MRISGAIIVVLLLWFGSAHAENKGKAREAFRVGTQHYKLAEYGEALDNFKEAYRNFEDPTFLFNIAQCQRQLNNKAEAIRFYRNYLIDVPNAPNREEVRQLIAKLEAALATERDAQAAAQAASASPPAAAAPVAPAVVTAPLVTAAPPPRRTPVYKKWWLWTAVGGAVAIGLGVGLGIGLSGGSSSTLPGTTFGSARPF